MAQPRPVSGQASPDETREQVELNPFRIAVRQFERTATYILAVGRVADATRVRGTFP
jgi:hypothetical protein